MLNFILKQLPLANRSLQFSLCWFQTDNASGLYLQQMRQTGITEIKASIKRISDLVRNVTLALIGSLGDISYSGRLL